MYTRAERRAIYLLELREGRRGYWWSGALPTLAERDGWNRRPYYLAQLRAWLNGDRRRREAIDAVVKSPQRDVRVEAEE